MTSTTWFSLRRRLLLLILGGVSVCWLTMVVWSYADAHHEIDELFDAQLAQTAQSLLALGSRYREALDDEDDDDKRHRHGVEKLEKAVHRYQRNTMFQIWHDDGELVLRSHNAPTTPLTDADGFSEVRSRDGHWRYYSQWDEHRRHRVLVAESHAVRDELIGHIAWQLLAPALLGLPLLGAWVWLAIRRGLAPLKAVAGQIADREPQRLHALAPTTAPEEIRPLVESINDLFGRVDQALESERRFTADAAHELRTPLAALATQAQVALRARDEDERRHAIEQLIASARRAGRLVDQLLTLARLDPEEMDVATPVRLDRLAEEACAAHGTAALEKDIALALEAAPAEVPGNADMLRILLRNLVDNAIRYTPAGGQVTVRVAPAGGGAVLTVEDSGPGIPAEERERVFHRFHRLAGQETEGSGLGLSIVARIAERHGATLDLADGDGGRGLRVAVRFSAA